MNTRVKAEWMSLREAAVYLRLSPNTLRTWIRERGLPAAKLSGTVVRIRRADLDAWVEEQAEINRGRQRGRRISEAPREAVVS